MAPVSRRSFLAGLIAAPIIAAITPAVQPEVHQFVDGWQTPNGEPITGLQPIGERLFVFTRSAVYELRHG